MKQSKRVDPFRLFSVAALALLVCNTFITPADAARQGAPAPRGDLADVWQPINCGLSDAEFITLLEAERKHGFGGNTLKAVELDMRNQTSIDSAHGQLTLGNRDGFGGRDFRQITVDAKGVDKADVEVKFCFRSAHGSGPIVTYRNLLHNWTKSGPEDAGWQRYVLTSRDFGGLDVRSMELARVTFSLTAPFARPRKAVIGFTQIQEQSFTLAPITESKIRVDCIVADECPPQVGD